MGRRSIGRFVPEAVPSGAGVSFGDAVGADVGSGGGAAMAEVAPVSSAATTIDDGSVGTP